MKPEVFEKITAKHYLVSGDGKHGNPEPDMFKMLFEARGNSDYTIHMTYSPEEIKSHKEYKKNDLGRKLDSVLKADSWRKSKLRWPTDDETSITVEL